MLTSRAVWRERERVEKGALFGESDGKSMLGSESFSWETGRAVQCRARAARRVRAVPRMCIVMALEYSIVPGFSHYQNRRPTLSKEPPTGGNESP